MYKSGIVTKLIVLLWISGWRHMNNEYSFIIEQMTFNNKRILISVI